MSWVANLGMAEIAGVDNTGVDNSAVYKDGGDFTESN